MNAVTASTTTRKLAGTTVGIPPRQVSFRFPAQSSRYFYDDNATATAFFVVLSAIFPPGERFFVESVRRFRDRVTDETLKAQVSGFIGQESIHGREHERMNEFLMARGIDTSVPDKAVRMGLWLLEQLSPSQQLACTVMMEHFTAALAEQLLTDRQFRSKADPELLKIWQWHALEELEHKSVAYDVYGLVGNSWRERVLAVPFVVGALLPGILLSWGYLVAREGKLNDGHDVSSGIGFLLGKRGFITKILPKLPPFIARRFHPAQHDTRVLEREWREKLFGAQGQLLEEFRNRETAS
jgi:predicted metal-dependent hydrolase